MEAVVSLCNHFLIAMPTVQTVYLKQAVIYICEHHAQGTVGLIINRPLSYPLGLVFNTLAITPKREEQNQQPLLFGGPAQTERGFVIHRPVGQWRSSLHVSDEVTITTSNDIIQALADDVGPTDVLVAMGYVGWDREQLDKEMSENRWLVCPYSTDLLYHVPFAQRWSDAAARMGITVDQLVEGSGHA